MKVRKAEEGDREAVWGLLQIFATSYPPERSRFDSGFLELLTRDDSAFLVLENEGHVVGYLLGHIMPTLFAGGPIFEIGNWSSHHFIAGTGMDALLWKPLSIVPVNEGVRRSWSRPDVPKPSTKHYLSRPPPPISSDDARFRPPPTGSDN